MERGQVAAGERREAKERELLRIEGHDLRSPLANIRSYVGMMLSKRGPPLDPRTKRATEVIAKNADRGLALIEDWIDWQLLQRGMLELEASALPFSSQLQLALEEVGPEAEAAEVHLQIASLPQSKQVLADPAALQRIFAALLRAAIQRSPAEGVVELEVRERDGRIFLFVASQGEAPPAQELALAFDFEEQTLASRKLSVGLSLALAKALAEALGGQASAQASGGGLTYLLALPAA